MCVEIEAFLRVSAVLALILSVLNIIYFFTIGRLFARNKKSVFEQSMNIEEIKKYGKSMAGMAMAISAAGIYIWEHPFKLFLISIVYFIVALFFPGVVCN